MWRPGTQAQLGIAQGLLSLAAKGKTRQEVRASGDGAHGRTAVPRVLGPGWLEQCLLTSLGPRTVEGGSEHPPPSAQWALTPSHIETGVETFAEYHRDGWFLKTKDKQMSPVQKWQGSEAWP